MKSKKQITTVNTNFPTVKEKVSFIHKNCHESELFEPLRLLFKAKSFENVQITHGNNEFGKDLVFSMTDSAIDEKIWYSAIVKNKNAQQNDFVSGGEIQQQVELSLKHPFLDPSGKKIQISRVFVIINGSVTQNAREVLCSNYEQHLRSSIIIWDYQRLISEIESHTKDLFLGSNLPSINMFDNNQITVLSDISKTNQLLQLNMKDIDEIFVSVQTTNSKHMKKVENYVMFDEDNKSRTKNIEDIDGLDEVINSDKSFIVHGIPTSGKTLFLKRLGIRLIKEQKQNLVFFFEIPEIVDYKVKTLYDLKEKMIEQFKIRTNDEKLEFENYSKIVLLLDSFDDIKDENLKCTILEKIDTFLATTDLKNLQIVLAMRTTEIIDKEQRLSEFEKTELLPFNIGQALKLVEKIIPNNKAKSTAFTKAMKDSMLSSSILRTPLALTLMAILYRDETIDLEELPANITELYNKFTDTYLDRWDTSKGVSQQYKYEQTKNILGFIAMEIHSSEKTFIYEDELIKFLTELRKVYNYEEIDNPYEFVQHLKQKSGVLNYDENMHVFSFFNHYFQEYFVSLCIDENNENDLKDNFFEEWWENAIVFYCGKTPRRDKFILEVSKNVVPVELKDLYIYLGLLSKSLQASHAIPINSRLAIVKRMISVFDNFFVNFIKEGEKGNTFAAASSTMDIVLIFRDFFEKLFGSKHISNDECMKLFESILLEENNNLSELTNYCISYFVTFHRDSPTTLELFLDRPNIDVIWQRIVYIDLKLLHYKSKDIKSFKRIKKKMDKNKFLILSKLKDISTNQLN
ncbi:NACHT domain-containing protein [Flavobacterium sp.]|uniref:NACHT domain-containing protein n=1 Tax=Flavobacterium sp. TaxID=239 RepID=UPI002FD89972